MKAKLTSQRLQAMTWASILISEAPKYAKEENHWAAGEPFRKEVMKNRERQVKAQRAEVVARKLPDQLQHRHPGHSRRVCVATQQIVVCESGQQVLGPPLPRTLIRGSS
ncbi:hypothetical protein ACX80W_11450 [Arthrobacter sp. TMN-37]